MAMTDEEKADLDAKTADLEATKKQLHELLATAKAQKVEGDAEKKRNASPGKVEVDPDLAKEIQELKLKVSKLEGSRNNGAFDFMDMFKTVKK